MKSRIALKKSILAAITVFCLILTASFSMPMNAQAYTEKDGERIYSPYEYDGFYDYDVDLKLGSDVPVSDTYKALIQYNISTGGTKYKGSGECWGYAEKIRKMFGGGGHTKYVRKKSTKKNIYNALKNVRPGTHVRFGNSKTGSGNHSVAVYKVTKDMIYFSDANWGYANQINHYAQKLSDFASYHAYNYIMWYIQPTGSPRFSSTKTVAVAREKENKIDVACRPVSGARSYTIYRASSKNGTYKKLKTVKVPFYTDKSPNVGNNYYKIKPGNRSMTAAKKVFNKLVTPTVHARTLNSGCVKLTWDKIKGAKKYGIYESVYNDEGKISRKRIKTVKSNSFTIKDLYDGTLSVRALASNSKANSGFIDLSYEYRRAPQPEILNIAMDETDGTLKVNVSIPYDLSVFNTVNVDLLRSTSKNGDYSLVTTAYAYASSDKVNDEYGYSYDYSNYQYNKDTFDPKTSVIKIEDYEWESNTTYYYKAVCYANYTQGNYSSVMSYTTPERPMVDVSYGNGTLHRYLGGDAVYYIDYDGTKYTEDLEISSNGSLTYTDSKGQRLMVDTDGYVWAIETDPESGWEFYDGIGYNTDPGYPDFGY